MKKTIQIDHLNKSFGDVKAVQDLSFSVKEGELFAFLGVNGAGKSTTINIMCGQLSKGKQERSEQQEERGRADAPCAAGVGKNHFRCSWLRRLSSSARDFTSNLSYRRLM